MHVYIYNQSYCSIWKILLKIILISSPCLILLFFKYIKGLGAMPFPFTKVPPSVLYVNPGITARLVWDYNVTNKDITFAAYSPTWFYRNTTQMQIAYEYKWSNPKWKWTIASTCPDTLRYRISKESTATLVISNVTTADNGIYQCTLALSSPTITTATQVRLIVTGKWYIFIIIIILLLSLF
jgi:hypothetical protein